jgi:signal transduction histidine kinase
VSSIAPANGYAGLAELLRLGTTEFAPTQLAEQAGVILMRITGAPSVRLSVESGTHRQVLFAAWPDVADAWRSRISLPLVAAGKTVGRVELAAPNEGDLDPSVRQFLDSAALVLGRLLGTIATELTQNVLELRTLQRVAETVSRSIDLEVVLGRCLEMALQVAHAPAGAIYLRDGQRGVFRRVQQRSVPEPISPLEIPASVVDPRFVSSSALVLDVVTVADRGPILDAARDHGFKRMVVLPLRVEERLVGLLGLNFFSSGSMPPSTLATLEAIAGQEAIAIENARVHHQAELRAKLAQILRQFAEKVLSVLNPEELYRLILEAALQLTSSDRGLVSRIVDDGKKVRVCAGIGLDQRLVGMEIGTDDPYVRETFERTHFVVEDTSTLEPRSMFGMVAQQNKTASFLLLIMRYQGKPIGHVFAGSGASRRYEPAELEAMQILAAMAAEVLERARVQNEADIERRRLDAIIEFLPIVIAVIDRSGKVVSLNRAGREFAQHFNRGIGLSDWRAGAARVKTLLTDGSEIPQEDMLISRAFRGEQPSQRELMLISEDGTRRMHVMSVAAPLFTEGGVVQQVATAFQDVSALRELADAKDRFLRVASHELRSPITSLRATTSLLEMDPAAVADPERRTVMLQRIHRQVDRLIKLVEQLLDSARVNADQVPIQPTDCELGAIVEEAIALAASSPADRARVRLEMSGPIEGHWDPLRIEQVLTNLVGNALRYSPQTAPVLVRVSADEPVRIDVVDQGIGIPPNQLGQVFSPFFRAANAQAHHKGGLGLGLHITWEIVRRHGGRIHVASELGKGSTFTVELPRRRT